MSVSKLSVGNQARVPFRLDINGLRAWAVLAVVLYHFGVPGFAGGFVGVDVFFVISGYLMTGIVVRGLERGSFSLFDFYMARGRRIIPALAVLCLVLLVLGWFFLLPPDYRLLGSHTGYSLAFLSNIEYFREAGYFDSASHEKWLLHTWSLSVEWQFYMVLPIVLLAAWRLVPGRRMQLWVVAAGFAASFLGSVLVTRENPSAAFFLLHTRAWEMLGGGLVLLLGQAVSLDERSRRWIERTGLLLILVSVAVFDKDAAWPGYLALLPVAASMMVVFANNSSVFTGNRVAQWLGERSYSLYLWHWPVCVALVYGELQHEPLAIAGGLLLTLILGHLSYAIVERHGKTVLGQGNWRAAGMLAAAVLLALGPALAVWRAGGVDGRFSPAVELAAAEAGNYHPRRSRCHTTLGSVSPACHYGAGGRERTALLVGDSHASVLVSALARSATAARAGVVQLSYSGCPYLPGMKMRDEVLAKLPRTYQCTAFNDWVRAQIAGAPADTPVVIAGRYASLVLGHNEASDRVVPAAYFTTEHETLTPAVVKEFARQIVSTACEAAKGGRPVYLVRPIPEMGRHVPKLASRRMSLGMGGEVSVARADYMRRNGWVWAAQDQAARQCGVKVIDPTAYLCRGGRCYGTLQGRPVYFDDDHLSEAGNALIAPLFGQVFGGHGATVVKLDR
ncbi:acyltransferase family protein [Massilia sp. GCM10023247]|uniref:acyltransferase family protein n=1 Tax=Massilia sp. GCM10023247 TaxID=3252643 RepID=UPI00360743D1